MNRAETFSKSHELAALTTYRPFIDGLRAVSILLVVLYHSGLPGISGGFVGVDVFFVISGFLIINQIRAATEADTFSFADFWSRRAVRILPPYLLVVVACCIVAPFVLVMPDDVARFGEGVFHSALMDANHFYWRLESYFDAASDTKVLLHLWSLSVEEQFYLGAPIVLAGMYYLARRIARPSKVGRWILVFTLPLLAVSLAGCILFTQAPRNYAFFFAPLRAWEFMAGGCIAFMVQGAARLPGRIRSGLGLAGLGAILLASVVLSETTRYPSAYAILPTSGAVLVILCSVADATGPASRILAWRPLVAIGLVSYAWYLWHWPLLVFMRISQFGERNLPLDLAALLVSLGLAVATWRFVERPLRNWRHDRRRLLSWMPLALGVFACLAVAFGGSWFFKLEAKRILLETPAAYVPQDHLELEHCDLMKGGATDCLAYAAGRPLGLVIGDSHALATVRTMDRLTAANGGVLATLLQPGCVGILGARMFDVEAVHDSLCKDYQARAASFMAERAVVPAFALIAVRWISYAGTDPDIPLGDPAGSLPAADQPAYFKESLRDMLVSLHALGVERIAILAPVPDFTRQPANCFFLARRNGMDPIDACGTPRSRHEDARHTGFTEISEAASALPFVRVIEPTGDFCDASRCVPFDGDTILYRDSDHISAAGMDRIVSRHGDDFNWLLGAARP